ncbi:MAG: PatB family C-S lyase [Alkalispirochaeta sp.]
MSDEVRDELIETPNRRGSGAFKWDLAGEDEIPMWVADMDFSVAPEITDALRRRIEHPIFGYTGVPDSYRNALAHWEVRRNQWEIDPRHMVVVPSVMPAMAVAVEALTTPGDRVVTFSPVYFPFFETVKTMGRTLVRVPLVERDTVDGGVQYAMDYTALAEALEGAALFLFCSPHNPGGRVWTQSELMTLHQTVSSADVPVIADEIHSDLVFPGERFVPWLAVGPATERDMALVAPSKTFNIPGLPTATAIIPGDTWRDGYKRALNAHMLRLPNILALTAAEAAYRHGDRWLDTIQETIQQRYAQLRRVLTPEPGVRVHTMEGTFIAWIDLRERWGMPRGHSPAPLPASAAVPDEAAGESVSMRFGRIARRQGVWLSDGSQFGPEGEGFMRMNIATSERNVAEGVARFRRALQEFDTR